MKILPRISTHAHTHILFLTTTRNTYVDEYLPIEDGRKSYYTKSFTPLYDPWYQ